MPKKFDKAELETRKNTSVLKVDEFRSITTVSKKFSSDSRDSGLFSDDVEISAECFRDIRGSAPGSKCCLLFLNMLFVGRPPGPRSITGSAPGRKYSTGKINPNIMPTPRKP